jgi:hypothetical protein
MRGSATRRERPTVSRGCSSGVVSPKRGGRGRGEENGAEGGGGGLLEAPYVVFCKRFVSLFVEIRSSFLAFCRKRVSVLVTGGREGNLCLFWFIWERKYGEGGKPVHFSAPRRYSSCEVERSTDDAVC